MRAQQHAKTPTPNTHETTAVPLGGKRIPQGMEYHQHWIELPEYTGTSVLDPTAYGEDYERLYTLRQRYLAAKQVVQAIFPPLYALLHQQTASCDAGLTYTKTLQSLQDLIHSGTFTAIDWQPL
uniref:Deoxyribose-phosphate aldolase n=1 Tax=Lygus hesperus TaxID=30085 RepID=A0A0A9WVY9_LYGHE